MTRGKYTRHSKDKLSIVGRDGVDLHLNFYSDTPKGHSVCWIVVTNIDALLAAARRQFAAWEVTREYAWDARLPLVHFQV